MQDDDKLAVKDDDIIAEAIEFRRLCVQYNYDNIRMAKDDLEFLSGNQLSRDEVLGRQNTGRPVIQINKLPTFLHQVTNDNLENTPSIKVHPVSDGADEEVAEILNGLIKNIEYSSNADSAYDTAVNFATAMGFGYFRVTTDYCNAKSFDQDIKISRIANPFSVHFDYASREPDGSDAERVMIETLIERKVFRQNYPKSNIDSGLKLDSEWVRAEEVLIGEYYRCEYKPDTLLLLANGQSVLKSELDGQELPEGAVIRSRETLRKTVMLYKLTATEILERTEIKCGWIPVFPVYGNEINIDGKIIRSGIVRNAKDPCRLYSYFWSQAAEEISARAKTPWIMAEGQDAGYEQDWLYANRTTKPYLKYKPTMFSGQLAPPPQRNQSAEFPSGFMAMAAHANDDIKATTGLFDSSLGAKGTATSGRQELAQQRQGDMATANYAESLRKSIRHCGRCIVSMIPYYYDTERVIRTIGNDGAVGMETINQQVEPHENENGAIVTVLNDLTTGVYDVTIDTGPSYQTQRLEAADSMLQMAQNYPQLMQVAGDKVIRALDWPNGDEIADRVAKSIPPEFMAGENKDEPAPEVPPEMMQAMQQDHEQVLMLQQELAAMHQELSLAKAEAEKLALEKQKTELQAQYKITAEQQKNAELSIELMQAENVRELEKMQAESANREAVELARIEAEHNERLKMIEMSGSVLNEQHHEMGEAEKAKMDQMAAAMQSIEHLMARLAQPKQSVVRIEKTADGQYIGTRVEE